MVDDIGFQRLGGSVAVERDIDEATQVLADRLDVAGLQIAAKKTVVLSNDAELQDRLANSLCKFGAKAETTARNLGV